jgi:hypothetical protein
MDMSCQHFSALKVETVQIAAKFVECGKIHCEKLMASHHFPGRQAMAYQHFILLIERPNPIYKEIKQCSSRHTQEHRI